MKRVSKCIKFLIFSITLALLSVLFSADTNASVNIEGFRLTNETLSLTHSNSYQVYVNQNPSVWVDGTFTWNNNTSDYIGLAAFRTKQSFPVKEGNIYKLSASFFFRGPFISSAPGALLQTVNSNAYFKLVAVEPVQCETITTAPGNSQLSNVGYSCVYDFYLQSKTTSTRQILIGTENTSVMFFLPPLSQGILTFSQDISIFEPSSDGADELNEKDEEDRTNIESQQSDSQSGADDSQDAAESTGTTLLGAFTGFVGALTSASPSNCNIDMDLGNLDLGVVNLCQLSLPQPFPTIASIMLILFCVPLSIATARKVINLFRSFQG